MNYYFLISSLPHISIGETPALSLDSFVEICREHLNKSDMDALLVLAGHEGVRSNHKFLAELADKEVLLRNAIVKARATKLNQDPSSYIRETASLDSHTEQAVSTAFSNLNPLERETALDRIRCEHFEEITGLDPFTGNAVLAYAAKLKVAQRWTTLNREKAQTIAKDIVNRNPSTNDNNTEQAVASSDQES